MNTLYYGDNLDIMRRKLRDETVDLCYIDPPFNSKRNYFQIYNNIGKEDVAQAQAFVDTWTWNELAMIGFNEIIANYESRYTRQTIELIRGLRSILDDNSLLAYLISMTQRVNEIHRILKPTGSFYLHCDPTASHYLKLVLDGIFCARHGEFRNEIVWHYRRWTNNQTQFQKMHDIILFYSKSMQSTFNATETDMSESQRKKFDRGWDSNVIHTSIEKYSQLIVYQKDKFDTAVIEGRLNPNKYKNIVFRTSPMVAASDVMIVPALNSQAKERIGYPTQKPEALLERIIQASSNEGDIVLDAYCGCGTTVAVAQRLKRQWIGIDITYQSIAIILKRLEDSFGKEAIQLPNLQLDGIPRDMESARALANKKDDRLRKEFEKWAILTYSNNRATINEKKGADKGVDGVAYIMNGNNSTDRIIFQVKSGNVKRNDIATLNNDRQREHAEIAILITLEEPTKSMREEAIGAGFYTNPYYRNNYPCIQIVTIQELIEENKRLDFPLNPEVLKTSPVAVIEHENQQLPF